MRWITIPAPIQLVDPATDKPVTIASNEGAEPAALMFTFSDYVRGLRIDERVIRGIEMIEAYEATASLIKGATGEHVPLQDATWEVLSACAKAPRTFAPIVVFTPSARTLVEAFTLAPTKKPEPGPGA